MFESVTYLGWVVVDWKTLNTTLIVKFTRNWARQKMYNRRRELKSCSGQEIIFINEDLAQLHAQLLYVARGKILKRVAGSFEPKLFRPRPKFHYYYYADDCDSDDE
ncbi:hypothetical protein DPMN_092670 [Dreissena polymorpha]|uniref:Uncharacterized protein n=1 Tax=Dreissena polymorpha TaxID=45954 RepID=A0A9D4R179_DREPO|nr:hypothetical protein DPMN_092670 [Dreissena polymorpha]